MKKIILFLILLFWFYQNSIADSSIWQATEKIFHIIPKENEKDKVILFDGNSINNWYYKVVSMNWITQENIGTYYWTWETNNITVLNSYLWLIVDKNSILEWDIYYYLFNNWSTILLFSINNRTWETYKMKMPVSQYTYTLNYFWKIIFYTTNNYQYYYYFDPEWIQHLTKINWDYRNLNISNNILWNTFLSNKVYLWDNFLNWSFNMTYTKSSWEYCQTTFINDVNIYKTTGENCFDIPNSNLGNNFSNQNNMFLIKTEQNEWWFSAVVFSNITNTIPESNLLYNWTSNFANNSYYTKNYFSGSENIVQYIKFYTNIDKFHYWTYGLNLPCLKDDDLEKWFYSYTYYKVPNNTNIYINDWLNNNNQIVWNITNTWNVNINAWWVINNFSPNIYISWSASSSNSPDYSWLISNSWASNWINFWSWNLEGSIAWIGWITTWNSSIIWSQNGDNLNCNIIFNNWVFQYWNIESKNILTLSIIFNSQKYFGDVLGWNLEFFWVNLLSPIYLIIDFITNIFISLYNLIIWNLNNFLLFIWYFFNDFERNNYYCFLWEKYFIYNQKISFKSYINNQNININFILDYIILFLISLNLMFLFFKKN